MAAAHAPARVDFMSAGPDFWTRYHVFRRLRQHESRPGDPVRPDETEERWLKRESPFDLRYTYEYAQDGELKGLVSGSTIRPGTPEYDTNKHLFWADLYVPPHARRQRIGSSLLPVLLELMDAHGCTTLGIGAEEASGHAFLKWVGAEARFSGAENRLNLAEVDWSMVDRWVDEGPQRSPDTRLEVYDGPLPEAMWDDFAPQLTILLNTVPFEDLDHGAEVVTSDHLRDFYEQLKIADERLHTMITREPDGMISAVTDTSWAPHRPKIIDQRFTGVRPEARGRGLGKWIKAAMLKRLRELYPEAEWISTANAGSNAPMLAINKKLGFRQYRAGTEYQISRDKLAARIQRLPPRNL
ncbi:MAG: GNAT family N-acetyltransferase [Candidatus Dormibacteraceae bacterium]